MKVFIVTLMISFLFTAGYSQQDTSKGRVDSKKAGEQSKEEYTCPMHPAVKSDKPGRCPDCGMNLVASNTTKKMMKGTQKKDATKPSGNIAQAIALLKAAKMDLAGEGKYNCCIETPCDRCLIDHQSCSCAKGIKEGKPVCSDCYAGWQRGDGIVKGVDQKKVKMDTHGHDH